MKNQFITIFKNNFINLVFPIKYVKELYKIFLREK